MTFVPQKDPLGDPPYRIPKAGFDAYLHLLQQEKSVDLKTAALAKEHGFNWDVLDGFDSNGCTANWLNSDGDIYPTGPIKLFHNYNSKDGFLSRPSQSHLQKWFRDVHYIDITIRHVKTSNPYVLYDYIIGYIKYDSVIHEGAEIFFDSPSYEETLERALLHAFKILQSKKET